MPNNPAGNDGLHRLVHSDENRNEKLSMPAGMVSDELAEQHRRSLQPHQVWDIVLRN
ncbi:MAG TPA: hypothetical protein VGO22_24260 [Pseudorhizobium sp.]|nr:hypothetical protein [Pseudorhizobium sp.]